MAPPRSTRSTDDPAGDPAQAEDSATVTRADAPVVTESTPAPEATAEPAEAEQLEEQPVVDAPAPVGRPPLSDVAEAAARGAFPDTDAQEG